MNLKELGKKEKFPANWYQKRMVVTKEPCEMHGVFELKAIPRLFLDDELQIKFQNFVLECDTNRVMVAYLDLVDDLKAGVISVDDSWGSYTDPTKFIVFPNGEIRWDDEK